MADKIIHIEKLNASKLRVHAPKEILIELAAHLEFYVDGYKFHPKYRAGQWDGKIRLLSTFDGKAPCGLFHRICEMLDEMEVPYFADDAFAPDENIPEDIAARIAQKVKATMTPRDYQDTAVFEGLSRRRALILSPTGSGKSFTIFLLNKYFEYRRLKTLIIVPRKALSKQLQTDYTDYQGHANGVQVIQGGATKEVSEATVVSTWQSIFKMDDDWFAQFDAVIVDEAHDAKAKSLTDIMNKCPHIEYRIGLTGTTDDIEANELTLEGHFGPKVQVAHTHQLIKDGILADLLIKIVEINYDDATCLAVSKLHNFAAEKNFLSKHKERNELVAGLVASQTGNVLALVEHRDHLDELVKLTQSKTDRKIFVIHGDIPVAKREEIRKQIESMDDIILYATYGSFSVGSNIKKLDKGILVSSFKSKIRVLQSIGRTLRKGNGSNSATIYDLADNLTHNGKPNHTYRHSQGRIEHYAKERLKWKTIKVNLKTSHS